MIPQTSILTTVISFSIILKLAQVCASVKCQKYCGEEGSLVYVLLDFSLTVKATTLIFISGCGSAISSANVVPTKSDSDVIFCYQLLSTT